MHSIIIDPGHGGDQTIGKSSPVGFRSQTGVQEKDAVLLLARHTASRLGGRAALTRDGNYNLSLAQRADTAAGSQSFVSLHMHEGRGGIELWVHPHAGPDSHRLASILSAQLPQSRILQGELAVLSPQAMHGSTAACMVEIGGLGNVQTEQWLFQQGGIEQIAERIAQGLQKYSTSSVDDSVFSEKSLLMTSAELKKIAHYDSTIRTTVKRKLQKATLSRGIFTQIIAQVDDYHKAKTSKKHLNGLARLSNLITKWFISKSKMETWPEEVALKAESLFTLQDQVHDEWIRVHGGEDGPDRTLFRRSIEERLKESKFEIADLFVKIKGCVTSIMKYAKNTAGEGAETLGEEATKGLWECIGEFIGPAVSIVSMFRSFVAAKIARDLRKVLSDYEGNATLSEIVKWARRKLFRRMLTSLLRALLSLIKAVADIVALATAGIAELARLIASALGLVERGYRAAHGMYKASIGTKGLHRRENAKKLLQYSLRDKTAAKMTFELLSAQYGKPEDWTWKASAAIDSVKEYFSPSDLQWTTLHALIGGDPDGMIRALNGARGKEIEQALEDLLFATFASSA